MPRNVGPQTKLTTARPASALAPCQKLLDELARAGDAPAPSLQQLRDLQGAAQTSLAAQHEEHGTAAAASLAVRLSKYAIQVISAKLQPEAVSVATELASFAVSHVRGLSGDTVGIGAQDLARLQYQLCRRVLLAGNPVSALLLAQQLHATLQGPAAAECSDVRSAVLMHILVCASEVTVRQAQSAAEYLRLVQDSVPAIVELTTHSLSTSAAGGESKQSENIFKCLYKLLSTAARAPDTDTHQVITRLLPCFLSAARAIGHHSKVPQYMVRLLSDTDACGAVSLSMGVVGWAGTATGDACPLPLALHRCPTVCSRPVRVALYCTCPIGDASQPALATLEATVKWLCDRGNVLADLTNHPGWSVVLQQDLGCGALAHVRLALLVRLALSADASQTNEARQRTLTETADALQSSHEAIAGRTNHTPNSDSDTTTLRILWCGIELLLKAVSPLLTDSTLASQTGSDPLLLGLVVRELTGGVTLAAQCVESSITTEILCVSTEAIVEQGLSCLVCASRLSAQRDSQHTAGSHCVTVTEDTLLIQARVLVGACASVEHLQWVSGHMAAAGKDLTSSQRHTAASVAHRLAWSACLGAAMLHTPIADHQASQTLAASLERRARAAAGACVDACRLHEAMGVITEAVAALCQFAICTLPSTAKLVQMHCSARLQYLRTIASQQTAADAPAPTAAKRAGTGAGARGRDRRKDMVPPRDQTASNTPPTPPTTPPVLTRVLTTITPQAMWSQHGDTYDEGVSGVVGLLDVIAQQEVQQYTRQLQEAAAGSLEPKVASLCKETIQDITGACIAATAHHPILHARALVLHALSTNTPIPDTAAQTLTDSCHTMLLAPHPPISHSAALSNVLTADTALVSAASIVLVPPPMQTGVQRDGDEGTDSSDSSMGTRDSVQTAGSVSLQGGQQEQGSMQCWDAASGADSQRQWMGRCETAAAALTQALQSLPAGSRGRCLPRPDATLQCVLQLWQQCQLLCLQAGMVAMEGAGRAIVQCAMGGSVSSHIAGVAACLPCGSVPWVYGEQRQHWPRSLAEAWGVETVCVPEVQQLSQDMQRIRQSSPPNDPQTVAAVVKLCQDTASTRPAQHGMLWLVLRADLLLYTTGLLLATHDTATAWVTAHEALKLTTAMQREPSTAACASGDAASAGDSTAPPSPAHSSLVARRVVALHLACLLQAAHTEELLGCVEDAECLLRECVLLAGQVRSMAVAAVAGLRLAALLHTSGEADKARAALQDSVARVVAITSAQQHDAHTVHVITVMAVQACAECSCLDLVSGLCAVLETEGYPAPSVPSTPQQAMQLSLQLLQDTSAAAPSNPHAMEGVETPETAVHGTGLCDESLVRLAGELQCHVLISLAEACQPGQADAARQWLRDAEALLAQHRELESKQDGSGKDARGTGGVSGEGMWPHLQARLLLAQASLQDRQGVAALSHHRTHIVGLRNGLQQPSSDDSSVDALTTRLADTLQVSKPPAVKRKGARVAAASAAAPVDAAGATRASHAVGGRSGVQQGGVLDEQREQLLLLRLLRAADLSRGHPRLCGQVWQALLAWAVAADLPHAAAMCAHVSQGLHHSLQTLTSCRLRGWGGSGHTQPTPASTGALPTAAAHAKTNQADKVLSDHLNSTLTTLAGALLKQCAAADTPLEAAETAAAAWLGDMLRQLPAGCAAACIVPAPGLVHHPYPTSLQLSDTAPMDPPCVVCRVSAGQPPLVVVLPACTAASTGLMPTDSTSDTQAVSAPGPVPVQTKAQSASTGTAVGTAAVAPARGGRARKAQTQASKAHAEGPVLTAKEQAAQVLAVGKVCGPDGLGRVSVFGLLEELGRVREDSAASMACAAGLTTQEEKAQWWRTRMALDARMAQLLTTMQDSFLGPWGWLLLQPHQPATHEHLLPTARALASQLQQACSAAATAQSTATSQQQQASVFEECMVLLLAHKGQLTDAQLTMALQDLCACCAGTGPGTGPAAGGTSVAAPVSADGLQGVAAAIRATGCLAGGGQAVGVGSVAASGAQGPAACAAADAPAVEQSRRDARVLVPPLLPPAGPAQPAAEPCAPAVAAAAAQGKKSSRLKALGSATSSASTSAAAPRVAATRRARVASTAASQATATPQPPTQADTDQLAPAEADATAAPGVAPKRGAARRGRAEPTAAAATAAAIPSEARSAGPALAATVAATAADCTVAGDSSALGLESQCQGMVSMGITTQGDGQTGSAAAPLLLVLADALHALPWESMPCMRASPARVYRTPSLAFAAATAARLAEQPVSQAPSACAGPGQGQGGMDAGHSPWVVDLTRAYYVLNPGKDLSDTQTAFEGWFERQLGWQGVAGCEPQASDLLSALESKSLYVYMGHGSGEHYVPSGALRRKQLGASNVLMGCSSGRLRTHGAQPPSGAVLTLLAAGCPAVVANLWDVTDKDIDRFSAAVLRSWTGPSAHASAPMLHSSGAGTQASFGSVARAADAAGCEGRDDRAEGAEGLKKCMSGSVASNRSECKLPHLIGAAPVCYGVPVEVCWKA